MKTSQMRTSKAIYSEIAVRKSDTVSCLATDSQRHARGSEAA